MKLMHGVINAMTTPFNEDGSVDIESLKKQVDFQIEKGVDCLYPLGTTGEMYLLSTEERKLVAKTVVEHANGRAIVYIHVGAMTTAEAIELAKHAESIGADGIGAVTPSYFGCSDRAIIQYYKDISDAVSADFPIYLYSIPQCSGNDIQPAVAQTIANQCKNVVGIKYSYPDMVRILNYININNGDFSVLVGPDKLFLAGLVSGAKGVVSGCAGPMPEPFVAIYKLYKEGKLLEARNMQRTAIKVIDIIRAGSDMGLFKEVLRRRGVVKNSLMRRPLLELETEDGNNVWKQLEEFLK
ncbi:MAG: dihydrodipicolinate synthase family protein [Succinatimonas sp.]|nr:dihydrodipicolinate synthase family protein [Succinatimonas sp.]